MDEDTAEAVRVVDEWQNPAECTYRKFILWAPGDQAGIGSNIHTIGACVSPCMLPSDGAH